MRILVVEDEWKIANLIQSVLTDQGYIVEIAQDGKEGLEKALAGSFDVLIVDVMLPEMDGLALLKELRERKFVTPVIFLTARGELSDRIEGLNLGADDYMAKPFAPEELVARVRALLRRTAGDTLTVLRIADLTMQVLTREITRGQNKIDLTPREFALLECLLRANGQVVTRSQMHEKVWGYHFDPGTNLVDVYIQRLRRKVDEDEPVKLIHTVRGLGYSIGVQPE